ncbi:MAG: hypothetical protein ACW968_11220 [Candidatus Thorarchaeota archaeon]
MKKAYLALTVFVMLSLLTISAESQTTFAQTEDVVLDPIDIMAYMFDNLSTRVIITARVNNVGDSDITNLRFRVDSLNVDLIGTRVDDESSEGDVVLQDRYTEIVITFPDALEENSTAWVYVEMNVGDLQSEQGLDESGQYALGTFTFYVRPISTFQNFTFTAIMPPHSSLSHESVSPVFPTSTANYTDGISMIYVWEKSTLQPGHENVFQIKYQTPVAEFLQPETSMLTISLLLIAGVMIGIAFMFVFPRVLNRLKQVGAVRLVGVTNEEEEILDAIRKKGGSCSQKELYMQFDLSQSKGRTRTSETCSRGSRECCQDIRE